MGQIPPHCQWHEWAVYTGFQAVVFGQACHIGDWYDWPVVEGTTPTGDCTYEHSMCREFVGCPDWPNWNGDTCYVASACEYGTIPFPGHFITVVMVGNWSANTRQCVSCLNDDYTWANGKKTYLYGNLTWMSGCGEGSLVGPYPWGPIVFDSLICESACGADPECDEETPGANIDYCSKVSPTYFADKCSSGCQAIDRGDNICRSSAFASDCTADPECNGVVAGTNCCDSNCNFNSPCTGDPDLCSSYSDPSSCADAGCDPLGECEIDSGWYCCGEYDDIYCVDPFLITATCTGPFRRNCPGECCEPITNPGICDAEIGCYWNYTGCSGTPSLCPSHTIQSICEATGCDWSPGDVDGNYEVNILDFIIVGNAFGSTPGDSNWDERADLNDDGRINAFDFNIIGRNFGNIC